VSDEAQLLAKALAGVDAFAPTATPREWEEVIREAREAKLLGALHARMRASGLLDGVPPAPRAHLIAGARLATAQRKVIEREIAALAVALRSVPAEPVLLKGAAYLAATLPCAEGRIFSDVDILVPHGVLPQVEAALMLAGYATTHSHPYDQRYYRRWMHELPPMQHVRRGTVVDVHHTIVPRTSRIRLDPMALFNAAVPLPGDTRFRVLSPVDMVVHSAAHLFNNEDQTSSLRDLLDIDALLRHYGGESRFWETLPARAADLDLWRPLHYALTWAPRLFGTPVPDAVMRASARNAPPWVVARLMDHLLPHALRPSPGRAGTRWARRLLYLRGQWLKMPLPLLAWHLTVKSLRREERPA